MEKSKFTQSELQVIEEAKQLRNKLIQMKKKKEQSNAQAVRNQLTQLYTQKFEQFKTSIHQHQTDQLTSLELTLELRSSQLIDLQNRLKDYVERLEQQTTDLKDKGQELDNAYEDALAFLKQQEEEEMNEAREREEKALQLRVQEYRDSIDIE